MAVVAREQAAGSEVKDRSPAAAVKLGFRNQRLLAWSGPVGIVIMLVGYWPFARFLPPPSPASDAETIAQFFRVHATGVRIGMVLMMAGATFWITFCFATSMQLRRIEGAAPLAWANAFVGAPGFLLIGIPALLLSVPAFRPELPVGVIQALNDIAWLIFIGYVYTIIVQVILITMAIFQDQREDPIFPRWVGYYNLVALVTFIPGAADLFFRDGPIAWDGLLSFWVAAIDFVVWILVMAWATLRAVDQEEAEFALLSGTTSTAGQAIDLGL